MGSFSLSSASKRESLCLYRTFHFSETNLLRNENKFNLRKLRATEKWRNERLDILNEIMFSTISMWLTYSQFRVCVVGRTWWFTQFGYVVVTLVKEVLGSVMRRKSIESYYIWTICLWFQETELQILETVIIFREVLQNSVHFHIWHCQRLGYVAKMEKGDLIFWLLLSIKS